ncbi:MarR family winged helix-turn-helix transcriptional regulator [Haloparvum sedimenti]|uniref:MarR family winged helix-turn-helix transcriptional regulator n=1 Tax=Haloparvum sedimenti TaxID=1678448 RepID=UPI00071E6EA9|nr:MarR family winged helix-turn-helix transcriptional regulator [Haloparvum sedimenti]
MVSRSAAYPHVVDTAVTAALDELAERGTATGPELVEAVGLNPSTVREGIRQACDAGEIARRPCPTDPRMTIYSLAEEGDDGE